MRWLRRGLLGLLAVVLLIGLVLAALLGTQAGSRWLLEAIPELEVEGFSGRLGGSWQAERLSWDAQLRIERVNMAWRPGCLLRRTLCLDRLEIGELAWQLAEEPAKSDNEPFALPDLRLPLRLELGHLQLDSLQIEGERFAEIELEARSEGDRLRIEQLQIVHDDLRLRLQAELGTSGAWPLSLQAALRMPQQDGQPWGIELQAEGELAGRLELRAQSQGYLQAEAQGEVAPLDDQLPARLLLNGRDFLATGDLPENLRLATFELEAAGDLLQGYRLAGKGQLAADGTPVDLDLAGLLETGGLLIEQLRLQAGEGFAEAQGRLDWEDSFATELKLEAAEFPWQCLYPAEVPVAVQRLQADFHYADEQYRGELDGVFRGPAGEFSLRTQVQGDAERLALSELRLQAGQGRIEGQGDLTLGDALGWQADLQLHEFDPAYWLAELPGQLEGPISSRGASRDGQLNWTVAVELQGQLRRQPASLVLDAAGQGEDLRLPALAMRLGDNRLDGDLVLAQALDGALKLHAPRLDQLWPGLGGTLQAQLDLGGHRDSPQASLQTTGQGVAWQTTRLGALDLTASLQDERLELALQADAIEQGDIELGQLVVKGDGRLDAHRAQLDLQGPTGDAHLALEGSWRDGDWRGRLKQARLQAQRMDWQLQAPTALARLADGRLELAAHCWRLAESSASLCAGNQRLNPDPHLDYRLQDFPLAMLEPWLPELSWDGALDGELRLDLGASGPRGEIRLDAGSGRLRSLQTEELELSYQTLRLSTRLTPNRVDSRLEVQGRELGSLDLQVALDPRRAELPLDGRFSLQSLQLSALLPLFPALDRLEGRIDGQGLIGGVLRAPVIDGELRLRDGALAGPELPLDAEALQLRASLAGQRLTLDGDWRSGEFGHGRLAGHLDWQQGLDADLQLQAGRLPLRVEPYAELEAEPDLRLVIADGQTRITGRIAVPRGAIQIRELPPNTVQVSEDARLVGDEAERGEGPNLAMQVEVEVGSDRLTFEGFGLTAELAGHLRIGDNLDTRGELNLNKGRYRAYGQRLTIRRARLYFAGPIERPYLDIEAIRRVDQVVAGLRLRGPADRPQSEVFSEPAMAQEQALSYLVLGRPLGNSGEDANLLGQAALALGLAGSSKITGGIARLLGIADFELDTQGSGLTTSVVASGRITERLSLRYGVGVFEPASTLALRYELTRQLYLEAASGLASSLDLFYRRDF